MKLDKLTRICSYLQAKPKLLVITGAGCSTASGIGDYRDRNGDWKRPAPVMHQAFVDDEAIRRRYWMRSMVGWPAFARATPNQAHQALAWLQGQGMIGPMITQNVDRLHQECGSHSVIDLHGRLDVVVCLTCSQRTSRTDVQEWLMRENAEYVPQQFELAPDGDADVPFDPPADFRTPRCSVCEGILKPDVVFYGDSVPGERVQLAYDLVDEADGLLIVGSSLMVYSAYRFCRRAMDRGIPMVAINRGRTRADEHLLFKIDDDCSAVLQEVCAQLGPRDGRETGRAQ
jgi:NAD-dependent SIR2 family protein deacetylase